ncbi:MAG: hypothetical protein MJ093_07460 [Saccharofermentans sp.]|nr:hypothetical protein [Saccharofermentans sp.]
MDNPIAIQMDWEDGNPTRALQYVDSEGSYHIGLIHYDSATGEFQISDSIAAG